MNRLEALEHFQKTYAKEVLNQKMHQVVSLYEQRKEEIILSFIQSFQWICQQANHIEVSKGRIGYITYSMRRTYLMERNYNYIIEAYDKSWFFDPGPCQGVYDAGWAFSFWGELVDELSQLRIITSLAILRSIPSWPIKNMMGLAHRSWSFCLKTKVENLCIQATLRP